VELTSTAVLELDLDVLGVFALDLVTVSRRRHHATMVSTSPVVSSVTVPASAAA
jgi:hypothetical protein